jgi:hypothetical protein
VLAVIGKRRSLEIKKMNNLILDNEPISSIYLRHGLTAKVPSSMAEKFLIDNEEILESRKIPVRGKRRVTEDH